MDKHVRELTDGQLDGVCGGTFGALRFLTQIYVAKANIANAELTAAADHQRQSNDRMAQIRNAQSQVFNLTVG